MGMLQKFVLLLSASFLLTGCAAPPQNWKDAVLEYEYYYIAHDFILHEPTYASDAIPGTLVLVNTSRPDYLNQNGSHGWTYTFAFNSAHSGYGDLKNRSSFDEVVTHHTVVITVTNGNVTTAPMDFRWDMIRQLYYCRGHMRICPVPNTCPETCS